MSNRTDKPMLSPHQLINKMRDEKGITFNYVSEKEAELYLTDVNNYLRVASYRRNYQKHENGTEKGKYIDLDFAYLQELSIIDMHLRFLLDKMCSDIEHAIKVQLIKDISIDDNEDGYTIVKQFIDEKKYILKKLENMISSPFTGDLLNKYFTIQEYYNPNHQKDETKIVEYDDCPVWAFCEFLSFGDTINLYEFYHSKDPASLNRSILNLIRSLRNAAAHNNCILGNLQHGTSNAPKEIRLAIRSIPSISKTQANKKLSCRPMLEITSLFFVYKQIVTGKVKSHRIEELKWLFFDRMPEKKEFFKRNELITTNYEFICKVINTFFD